MSILKDNNIVPESRNDKFQGQLRSLKNQTVRLRNEVDSLRSKIPPRTEMDLDGSNLVITEIVQERDRTLKGVSLVDLGDAYSKIQVLLTPLVRIARAAALSGQYKSESRQKAHVLGPDGRPTKELKTDGDGKQVYLPNDRDRAIAISEMLMSNPETRDALEKIANALIESREDIQTKSHKVANRKKSSSKFDVDL